MARWNKRLLASTSSAGSPGAVTGGREDVEVTTTLLVLEWDFFQTPELIIIHDFFWLLLASPHQCAPFLTF